MASLTGRKVLVGRRSVLVAYQSLNRIMVNTGLVKKVAQGRYYEKPTKKRERLEYEKCRRLYDKEMKRKIEFVMKQNDPIRPI